jgi:hypothetical protein
VVEEVWGTSFETRWRRANSCRGRKLLPVSRTTLEVLDVTTFKLSFSVHDLLKTVNIHSIIAISIDTMGYYLYEALKSRGRPIRLLKILPAQDSRAELQCQLEQANLDEAPEYLALSYCWGKNTGKGKVPISVNRASLFISKNLDTALRHLRIHFCRAKAMSFWADALCVDQFNMSERSQQVQMMGSIYSKARQVVLWLGREENDSDLAMDLINALGTGLISASDRSTWSHHPHLVGKRAWEALGDWGRRPVWNRIWILQEFVLNRELVILCGTRLIPWSILEAAFKNWKLHIHNDLGQILQDIGDLDLLADIIYCGWMMHNMWHNLRIAMQKREPAKSICQVLFSASALTATDPRDMIYGLLGICHHDIGVDYSKSTRDVYIDFAAKVLENGQYQILDAAGSGVLAQKYGSCDLPSWVPDWHARGIAQCFPWAGMLYNAGTLYQSIYESLPVVARSSNILFMTGRVCQTVTQTFSEDIIYDNSWWRTWTVGHARSFPNSMGLPFLQALFRTFLRDTGSGSTLTETVSRLEAASFLFYDIVAGFLLHLDRMLSESSSQDEAEGRSTSQAVIVGDFRVSQQLRTHFGKVGPAA